jgi:hypothetical protein
LALDEDYRALESCFLLVEVMLEREDIAHLIARQKLFQIEVDSRHMALINEVFQLGVNVGINQAKESVVWRINGPLWASFIDEGVTNAG